MVGRSVGGSVGSVVVCPSRADARAGPLVSRRPDRCRTGGVEALGELRVAPGGGEALITRNTAVRDHYDDHSLLLLLLLLLLLPPKHPLTPEEQEPTFVSKLDNKNTISVPFSCKSARISRVESSRDKQRDRKTGRQHSPVMMSASFRATTTTTAENPGHDTEIHHSSERSLLPSSSSEEKQQQQPQEQPQQEPAPAPETVGLLSMTSAAAYGSLTLPPPDSTTTNTIAAAAATTNNNVAWGAHPTRRIEQEDDNDNDNNEPNDSTTSPLLLRRHYCPLPSHISVQAQPPQSFSENHSSGENNNSNNKKNKQWARDDSLALQDDHDNEQDEDDEDDDDDEDQRIVLIRCGCCKLSLPPLRQMALTLSLSINIIITIAKFVAYLQTFSLSVLAALLDSVLDTVSQVVLGYTEHHSSKERSSAFYPAGASRLEAIGVLGIAALMGMASFEVLKDSIVALLSNQSPFVNSSSSSSSNSGGGGGADGPSLSSFWSMLAIVIVKIQLFMLCTRAANKRLLFRTGAAAATTSLEYDDDDDDEDMETGMSAPTDVRVIPTASTAGGEGGGGGTVQLADPTLQALAQDHFNDALSNGVAAVALLFALRQPSLWFLDPIGAICISLYIIYSWFMTGREQIEQLIGKSAPDDFIAELTEIARVFDERIVEVDVVRAYHFGPKFLVEIEIVMPKETSLFESHDVGMELQYEIEAREEVERCFVHIDYQQRPYDEHVVSKVPELREKYRPKGKKLRSVQSV